jgi:signal transduction histidine kinase
VVEKNHIPLLERYQRLLELSRDLNSTLDLPALLNHIVKAASDLCQAEAASILLYDEGNQELYFEAASNLESPEMKGLVVPVDSSIAGWIITEQRSVIINDVRNDPRHFNQIGIATDIQTISLLGVPLITKDKVVGVLEAINKLFGEFTREDQELLLALGAHAAIAIENARLFQQSDLISEFVHEIRTPLTSINAAAHLLARSDLSHDQRNTIFQTMEREMHRLSEMTTTFLDLARMESGRSQLVLELIKISQLLGECTEIIQGEVREKNQIFTLNVNNELPPIEADREKLKQVILNLFNNAVKYTPPGGKVDVNVFANNHGEVIKIADTGIGIPTDSLPFIFDKFYRVTNADLESKGTGLGLAISQRIIEAHQGRIDVESKLGNGSTFTVFLPLTQNPVL